MLALGGGAFLGWALGANDAANVFGTAVAARVVRFSTAAIVCAVCVVLGAWLEGRPGIETLGALAPNDLRAAVVASLSAAIVVTFMTWRGVPVSTSQAVVGAILGIGLTENAPNWAGLPKILICWVATPIGAVVIACILYTLGSQVLKRTRMSMLTRDNALWGLLVVVGAYGSYTLGANNVGNVTGVYAGTEPFHDPGRLALLGGVFIGAGAITFSRRVMMTVGARLVRMDAYAALVATSAQAFTMHVFAWIGVPVSASQAIIGAVVGVGLMRGTRAVHATELKRIGLSWLLSPITAAALAALLYRVPA